MNFLLLDIGNTSIAYSITKNGKVTDIHRVENQEYINKFMKLFDFSHIDKTLICSVVPSISDSVVDVLKYKDVDYFEINYTHAKTKLLVDKPSEVGNDRICNIMGAKVINAPAIIIDFGTATTYDIINENGDFIGGAISPGIDISADYLINKAALLKTTAYIFPNSIIGTTTESNIQSGVMYGGLFSVIGMINSIKSELGNQDVEIIITGGFGKLISDKLDIKHKYIESLTMDGMLNIYSSC